MKIKNATHFTFVISAICPCHRSALLAHTKSALAILTRALMLFAILLLAGCGRNLRIQEGQIFIATQGGQNVKLGAVEILAFDETTIKALLKQREAIITSQQIKLQQAMDAAQSGFRNIEEPYKKAMTECNVASEQYNDESDLLRQETEKAAKLTNQFNAIMLGLKDVSNSLARDDQRIADIQKDAEYRAAHTQDEMTRKILLDGTNNQVSVILEDKQYLATKLKGLLSDQDGQKQHAIEQATVLDAERRKFEADEAELAKKQEAKKVAVSSFEDAQQKLAEAKQAMADFSPFQILFADLPQPAVRTVSDADGKFRLEFPSAGRFAVFAHAQRTVGETENYIWLVWSDEKGGLLLNNANEIGTKSAVQVLTNEF